MRHDRYPDVRRFDVTALLPVAAIILLAFLLTGCGPRVVTRDRVETVSVPVIQKCAGDRPAAVVPISQRLTAEQWAALSPKQKAETTAAQALTRMNHADELNAATSAC